jgi:hypothetical protein
VSHNCNLEEDNLLDEGTISVDFDKYGLESRKMMTMSSSDRD